MGNSSQDSELHNQDKDRTTNGDENLAHDDISNILVRGTEMDHEAESEDVDGDSEVEGPLVEAGLSNEEADDKEKHTRNDLESRVDIPSLSRTEVDDDLQEGRKEVVPGVVGDLVSQINHAGGDDGSIKKETTLEEGDGGEPILPNTEKDESAEADNDHGDDIAGAPAVWSMAREVEWEKEDNETSTKEEDSDHCIIVSIRDIAEDQMQGTYHQTR